MEVVHVAIIIIYLTLVLHRGLENYPLFVLFFPCNSLEIRKLCFLETSSPSAIYKTLIL